MILTVLMLISAVAAQANAGYIEAMQKAIDKVYKAETILEIQEAVNVLDRISNAEKGKWEPSYYAAFGYIMMATKEADVATKDKYLDQAKVYADRASAIQPNNDEIITLEGFISTIRVSVDPATRGQQYSGLAMQAFGKALALNPNNPRALGLMAQMQFGTARFFHASTGEACATARKAQAIFAVPPTGTDALAPVWGKGMVEGMVANCK